MAPIPSTSEAEGHYDVRRGAAAYAPIVGAFGALAVPTVTVLFTSTPPGKALLVTMATGLLVVATIASLTGSIGLAAIGAERDETANLPPAVMCIAVAVVVSIVSVLAAFEVLAAIYLPSARTLFSIITGVGGLAGAYFTSFTVGDCYRTGPRDPSVRPVWLARQWIQDQRSGYKHAQRLAILGAIPILMAMAVRVFVGHFEPTSASVNTLGRCWSLAFYGRHLPWCAAHGARVHRRRSKRRQVIRGVRHEPGCRPLLGRSDRFSAVVR